MPDPKSMTVEQLENAIRYHNWKYWIENAPEISDYEYDRLVEALRERRADSPVLTALGPEAIPEGVQLELGDKVTHRRSMLSLDKCYSDEELFKWWDKFEGDAVASPKVDGVAASIRYDGAGRLELAATRGTGLIGEAITPNIRLVADVPESIPFGPAEVRGEVYMPLSVFRTRFANEFANPRNLTAGALKQKDSAKTAEYRIRFMAYDIEAPPSLEISTEVEKLALLQRFGFQPVEQTLATRDAAAEVYASILARRDDEDYETDGVVFKANRLDEQERLGATAHHPRYAIAYKYQGESGVSTLREVEWSVSRTGAINPVAIVDPIELSGVTVTRASLHNLKIMKSLAGEQELTLGSKVLMMRRGGVIPHVEQVIEPGDLPVQIPDVCPSCGGPTTGKDDRVLFADHKPSCPATRLGQLSHFVRAIDAKGFGPKLLSQLIEAELVEEPADLYELTVEALMPLERVGQKLAQKLVSEIEDRREISLPTFLSALGIDDLGPVVARLIASHYPTLDELVMATADELASIHGVGAVIAQNVVQGLADRRGIIGRLLEHVTLMAPEPAEPSEAEGPLVGTQFLFTGTLESMKRKEAQDLVQSLGGETPISVTQSLTHLVLGDADMDRFRGGWRSSKLKKAEALNEKGASIEIIGESEFLELVGRAP